MPVGIPGGIPIGGIPGIPGGIPGGPLGGNPGNPMPNKLSHRRSTEYVQQESKGN
jgi:hypothetical protein